MQLPEAPADLPPFPADFYAALRAALAGVELRWAHAEDDGLQFGDAGLGLVLTHAEDPDWVVSAQVSRVDAVVFVGPAAHHPATPDAAAALVAAGLRGAIAVELGYRGDALVSVVSRDEAGAELSRARVGGPGAWARWRAASTATRRMDFRAG